MADYTVSQFTVRIEENGSDYRGCAQYLVSGNVTGEEFWTEPMNVALGMMGGDELEMAIYSLSIMPGDTDDEFFEDMTAEELAWRKKHGEELSSLASDMNAENWEEQIEESFDWAALRIDAEANAEDGEGRSFMGTVMGQYPSGKFWCAWSTGNVSEYEQRVDEAYREALESVAESHGMWIENGEGDPCDLFACCDVPNDVCSVPVMRELPENVSFTRVSIQRLGQCQGYKVETFGHMGETLQQVIFNEDDFDSFKESLAFHPQDEGYDVGDDVEGDPIEDVESGYQVRFRIESGVWSEYVGTLQESC